jgi:hypothetical protein
MHSLLVPKLQLGNAVWKLQLPQVLFGRSWSFYGAVPKLELGNQERGD